MGILWAHTGAIGCIVLCVQGTYLQRDEDMSVLLANVEAGKVRVPQVFLVLISEVLLHCTPTAIVPQWKAEVQHYSLTL